MKRKCARLCNPRCNSILAIWPIKSNHRTTSSISRGLFSTRRKTGLESYVLVVRGAFWSSDYRNSSTSYCAMSCNSAIAPDTHGSPVGTFILFARRKHHTVVHLVARSGERKSPYPILCKSSHDRKTGSLLSRRPRKYPVEGVCFRSKWAILVVIWHTFVIFTFFGYGYS
jgi:hypothetical protein